MLKSTLAALMTAAALALCATSVSAAGQFTADRHVAAGMKCETCHGPEMKNPNYPDEKTCLQCHKREDVAAKTK